MTPDFLHPAKDELAEAVDYYNQQGEGLGFEFNAEVKRAIQRILQHPEAWSPISKRTRRCRTNRFPYGIIYQLRGERVLIVAIQNLHQHPDTWKSRLRKNGI